ncbi:hypothetical protein [Rhizobium miluonense]|uniref:hypothetical protein n=1 Tax=Rhizobium miluonense TaxID=411945 RepID=UPI001111CF75|nr:hypothetical protein [Rhizobium miluonense]
MTGFSPLASDKNSMAGFAEGLISSQAIRDMVLCILCTAQKHTGCRRRHLRPWQIDAEARSRAEIVNSAHPWRSRANFSGDQNTFASQHFRPFKCFASRLVKLSAHGLLQRPAPIRSGIAESLTHGHNCH